MVNLASKPASPAESTVTATAPLQDGLTHSTWQQLANQALSGETIARQDALAVLSAPNDVILDQLAAAYRVRRHYWGNRVRLHFLLNAQSGLCPED